MKRVAALSIAGALLAFGFTAEAKVGKGQHAPDFSLTALEGGKVSLSVVRRQRGGRRLLGAVVRALQKGAARARQAGRSSTRARTW